MTIKNIETFRNNLFKNITDLFTEYETRRYERTVFEGQPHNGTPFGAITSLYDVVSLKTYDKELLVEVDDICATVYIVNSECKCYEIVSSVWADTAKNQTQFAMRVAADIQYAMDNAKLRY